MIRTVYRKDARTLLQIIDNRTVLAFKVDDSLIDGKLYDQIMDDSGTSFMWSSHYNELLDLPELSEEVGIDHLIINPDHFKSIEYASKVETFTGKTIPYLVNITPGRIVIKTSNLEVEVVDGLVIRCEQITPHPYVFTIGMQKAYEYNLEHHMHVLAFVLTGTGIALRFSKSKTGDMYEAFEDHCFHTNPPDWFWQDPHILQIKIGELKSALMNAGVSKYTVDSIESALNNLIGTVR